MRCIKLDEERGRAAYDAILDKKMCPECKTKMAFNEWKEKRKLCQNCNVEFTSILAWGDVEKRFFSNQRNNLSKSYEKKASIERRVEEEALILRHSRLDMSTGKMVLDRPSLDAEAKPLLWTPEMEEAFFERMEEQAAIRRRRLQSKTNEIHSAQCTFQPTIRESAQDPSYDPVEEFMLRYEEDWGRRKERMEVPDIKCHHYKASLSFRPL